MKNISSKPIAYAIHMTVESSYPKKISHVMIERNQSLPGKAICIRSVLRHVNLNIESFG